MAGVSPSVPRTPPPLSGDAPGDVIRRLYAGAYLASSLVSGWLTYSYVGAGARELNPIVAMLVETLGAEPMVLVKVVVVVLGFHGYSLLAAKLSLEGVVGFAWVAALVHVLDALYDVGVALLSGWVPLGGLLVGGVLLVAGAVLGIVFRPAEVAPTWFRLPR